MQKVGFLHILYLRWYHSLAKPTMQITCTQQEIGISGSWVLAEQLQKCLVSADQVGNGWRTKRPLKCWWMCCLKPGVCNTRNMCQQTEMDQWVTNRALDAVCIFDKVFASFWHLTHKNLHKNEMHINGHAQFRFFWHVVCDVWRIKPYVNWHFTNRNDTYYLAYDIEVAF